ncbi:diguanylate cyclase (GGDEF) domain-containing protein [Actinoplanes derwentensis]|uniref:Diguanylate cyclase (GGDEF) domain-containing protein n=1 Tax=Actinoplanes derwentensis TaxID=113562 RepID=A0A1H1YIB6_9ACTN|nr:diguanylate cyclase (GGDEF) domain-containing protein [Actinoplanes derwentensis]
MLATARTDSEQSAAAAGQGSSLRRSRSVSWRLVAAAVLVAALMPLLPEPLQVLLSVVAVLGGVVTIGYAARTGVPAGHVPLRHLYLAGLLIVAGMVLRMVLIGADRAPRSGLSLTLDAIVIAGYLLAAYAAARILLRRRADPEDPAWIDAVLVGATFACLAWTYLVAPAIERTGEPTVQFANAFFPIVDVVLLALVAQLGLTGGHRAPALWMAVAGTVSLSAGDLCYLIGNGGLAALPAGLVVTLHTVALLLLGAATLHPSRLTLVTPQQRLVRKLSKRRMLTIALVLLVPVVMATLNPADGPLDKNVRGVLVLVLVLVVLFRVAWSSNSRARAEDSIRRRATHDQLTDLPNRELLSDTITAWGDRAAAGRQEISLLFIDLDRFKMINDHWGHRVGDELLCAVAQRLSTHVRSCDLVCRIGGDEFVIALSSPSHSILAESVAGRVLDLFTRPFALTVGDVVVSASIGVAKATGGAEAVELIRDADTAMYQAKESGRNTWALFDTSLRDQLHDRITLEQALRGAMRRGELYATYQPIIDLASGELDGFETLMRWEHPELGHVPPLRFIPVAEETGMIVEAGAWLLREAAGRLAVWRAERGPDAHPLHMSVNVSVRQLRDRKLVAVVRDVLASTGLPASALWLEITESGVMEDIDTALSTLNELHDLGVVLAIDDFGTGYSSLSYLNRLPVGIVKLDRSFVSEVGRQGANEQIVRAVLAMTSALDLRVVAEGVETEAQRDWLREQGCDLAQGWLFGKPLRAEEHQGRVTAVSRPG